MAPATDRLGLPRRRPPRLDRRRVGRIMGPHPMKNRARRPAKNKDRRLNRTPAARSPVRRLSMGRPGIASTVRSGASAILTSANASGWSSRVMDRLPPTKMDLRLRTTTDRRLPTRTGRLLRRHTKPTKSDAYGTRCASSASFRFACYENPPLSPLNMSIRVRAYCESSSSSVDALAICDCSAGRSGRLWSVIVTFIPIVGSP